MPRIAWCRLLILLIALPLASCFDADEPCPTCPPENGARIDIAVPRVGEVDSARIRVDGGAYLTVRRDRRGTIGGLAAGDHTVDVLRYYEEFGIISIKTSHLTIQLARGELRLIDLHNDFPQVSYASPPARAPARASRPSHSGWAGA